MACSGPPNETWGMTGSMPVVTSFKWDPDCFFERSKPLGIGTPRPVFPLSGSRANRSNWWFAEAPKRPSMGVRWPVPPLSGSRANRPNWWFAEAPKRPPMGVRWPVPPLSGSRANRPSNDDVWGLLRPPCRDCFEKLKSLGIDVPRSVSSLSENKANRFNWWFAEVLKRF